MTVKIGRVSESGSNNVVEMTTIDQTLKMEVMVITCILLSFMTSNH
jgi:hypothetical protein